MSLHAPEQWKPIPGFPHYEASTHGRIRSLLSGKPRLLRGHLKSDGYIVVSAQAADGARKTRGAHRLVAFAFHGPCPTGMECRHLNGDSTDNRPANLQWGTPSENQYDRVRHGTHPLAARTECPKGHPYDEENTLWRSGAGPRRLCRECNRAAYRRWYHNQKLKAVGMAQEAVA